VVEHAEQMRSLGYAVVTPARNEAANLRRLAGSMEAQLVRPLQWMIVDDGSTDDTAELAQDLAARIPWVTLMTSPAATRGDALTLGRSGGRDVVAFQAGIAALDKRPDVIVKLDADVSLAPDYFQQLLERFEGDPKLGIAGGICQELDATGQWQAVHVTRGHVRGAARAYRWQCFEAVAPLEERLGWDSVDLAKARVAGWGVRSFEEIPFQHHRKMGARDGSWASYSSQGDVAHFLGYRPSYLLIRTTFRAVRDPAALALIVGFSKAALARRERVSDPRVVDEVRQSQSLRRLPRRAREARGRYE
jgi:glycosyltransferase involved in cell wall biosynthesis